MSFANFDVEAQRSVKKDGEVDELSDEISEFANNLTKLETRIQKVGSSGDDARLRNLLNRMNDSLVQLSGLIALRLRNLKESGKDEFAYTKLNLEFMRLKNKFEIIQNTYHQKLQSYQVSAAVVEENERTPLLEEEQQLQHQQQIQVQESHVNERDLQYHQYLLEQRSQGIDQLSSGVQDVNVIFKDLNNLIQQQGEQLDTIEDNLIISTNNNQFAHQELIKLDKYQKRKGKWCFMLLIGLILLFIIVVLVML